MHDPTVAKRAYRAPRFEKFGSVSDITAGGYKKKHLKTDWDFDIPDGPGGGGIS